MNTAENGDFVVCRAEPTEALPATMSYFWSKEDNFLYLYLQICTKIALKVTFNECFQIKVEYYNKIKINKF